MELSGSLVIIHVRCSWKVLESIRLVIHLKNNLAYIVRLPDSVFVPFFIAFIIIFSTVLRRVRYGTNWPCEGRRGIETLKRAIS